MQRGVGLIQNACGLRSNKSPPLGPSTALPSPDYWLSMAFDCLLCLEYSALSQAKRTQTSWGCMAEQALESDKPG